MTKEYDSVLQRYRDMDRSLAAIANRMLGKEDFERVGFVPTAQVQTAAKHELDRLLVEAQSLPAPDAVLTMLQSHFQEFAQSQQSHLIGMVLNPARVIRGITQFLDHMNRKDSRDSITRAGIVSDRVHECAAVWDGLQSLLLECPPSNLKEVAEACDMLHTIIDHSRNSLETYYAGIPSVLFGQLATKLENLAGLSQQWAQGSRRLVTQRGVSSSSTGLTVSDTIQLEETYYRNLLQHDLGVDLADLLSWHEAEVEATREEVLSLAFRLGVSGKGRPLAMADVVEALNTLRGPCTSVEEAFSRGNDYLVRARAGTEGYVRLPEESCIIVDVPQQIRGHFPWGGYGGGCSLRRPLQGEMYINKSNYRAVTDGWLKMLAIHEAYPGHHVQFVRLASDPLPETVKLGARAVPIIEGAAHRSERVFEFVFQEDPYYPLFVAYRRHHTSVRIKAELWLRYFGRPIGDAVQLYMDELGFDRATARGQVKAQELMVGYFNCYYYGLKRITDLETQFGYDEKAFTEMLFSAGRISLDNFAAFLQLTPEDRDRYLTFGNR